MSTSLIVNEEVKENVKKYFKENLQNYEVIAVGHVPTEKNFIYRVLAKKKVNPYPDHMGDYSVWTCWNETTKSLNWGHYDLIEETAINMFMNDGSISKDRLIELASKAIDYVKEDEYLLEELVRELDMSEYEMEFFGVELSKEEF